MTTTSPQRADMTGHELLLRMAGRIPDQTLAQARRMLADGTTGPAIALVAELLAVTPLVLTGAELAAIRDLTSDAGALPGVQPVAEPPVLQFGFSEFDQDGEAGRDEIDEALVAVAEAHGSGLTGIWRTWRYYQPDNSMGGGADTPADLEGAAGQEVQAGQDNQADEDSRDSAGRGRVIPGVTLAIDYEEDIFRPHRVYVVQVDDPAMILGLAADLLGAVPDAAEAGIEIITLGAEPPPYQRAALAGSLLLWAIVTGPEFAIARVFDFADPVTGPGFAPDHPVIDDPDRRDRLLAYLRGGYPVMMTTSTMDDVLDEGAGAVVPASFRTDGEWIWTDTVVYYLDRHGLAPDAELTAYIEGQLGRGRLVPGTNQEIAVRAADFLLHPPPAQTRTAVWFPGHGADDPA